MPRNKAETIRTQQTGSLTTSRSSKARRRSKIGLVLIVWVVLLGWMGISSYNVIKQQYSLVYARDRATESAARPPDGERGATHDPAVAGPGVNPSGGVLLTSGPVVFLLATAIRLLMNRRAQNDT